MNKNDRNVGTVYIYIHTGVLDNNKKTKIYERDIYENASNCGAKRKIELNVVGADASVRPQDQIKHNLKTFEKFESDIVGVGVPKGITDLYSHVRSNNSEMPDDPKEKHKLVNKLKSNIPTSNIQRLTSNTAITLVALVITIVLNCCGAAMV